jgi:hypothetical protein
MIKLPDVTIICVDCRNYGEAVSALNKCLEQVDPYAVKLLTDATFDLENRIEVIKIDPIRTKRAYSEFLMKKLNQYIETSHVLIVQWDGYILDGTQWSDEYLKYDYLGARWNYDSDRIVGNGGFSLRSKKLHDILADDDFIDVLHPEDQSIGIIYKFYLEERYGIKFGAPELADKFSFELNAPAAPTFGFHGKFHPPYAQPIMIRRWAAMGDVIQVEPILEYFHKKGHPVFLDTHPSFYNYFARHYFPVYSLGQMPEGMNPREINLDMVYEVKPQQLHMKSYFEACGITDYVLRAPKLNFVATDQNRMFKKYVVVHVDERDTPGRNQRGLDWKVITKTLREAGYEVIQVSKNECEDVGGIFFNAVNEQMLMWVISGASFFIGIDSGVSNVAVALGIQSIILFGNVSPEMIHVDMSKIIPIQTPCPIQRDGCWHTVVGGTRGAECAVEDREKTPPCTFYRTEDVINAIEQITKL